MDKNIKTKDKKEEKNKKLEEKNWETTELLVGISKKDSNRKRAAAIATAVGGVVLAGAAAVTGGVVLAENQVVEIALSPTSISQYYDAKKFNISQLYIVATKANGKQETVKVTKDMLSIADYQKLQNAGTYVVTINYRGAACEVTLKMVNVHLLTFIAGEWSGQYMYIEGEEFTIPPVPEIEGFSGVWSVTDFSNITEDSTIEAIYTINTYSVSFYNGSQAIATYTENYNTEITAPVIQDIPDGKVFAGWIDSPDFEGNRLESTTLSLKKNVSYYALIVDRELTTETFKFVYQDETSSYGVDSVVDTSIVNAEIPEKINHVPVTYIKDSLFSQCKDLETVKIPATVTDMGRNPFQGCTKLRDVNTPATSNFKYDNGALVNTETKTLISGSNNLYIPEGVETIGYFAFKGIKDLPSGKLVLPDSVKTVIDGAFMSVSEITEIDLGNVETVLGWAFSGTSISTITIPNTLSTIGQGVFASSQLLDIVFEEGNPIEVLDSRTFQQSPNLNSIDLTNLKNLKEIGDWCFYNCSSLTTVIIDENSPLETIGSSVFHSCANLKTISLPKNLKVIKDSAFYNCKGLVDQIVVPKSLIELGKGAFTHDDAEKVTFEDKENWYYLEDGVKKYIEPTDAALFKKNSNSSPNLAIYKDTQGA